MMSDNQLTGLGKAISIEDLTRKSDRHLRTGVELWGLCLTS